MPLKPHSYFFHLVLLISLHDSLRYVVSLSGALALLNCVPCYALDGHYILIALGEYLLTPHVPDPDTRGLIATLIILFGTLLLGFNIVLALWSLFS